MLGIDEPGRIIYQEYYEASGEPTVLLGRSYSLAGIFFGPRFEAI